MHDSRLIGTAQIVIAITVAVAALTVASSFFAPLALALVIMAVVWPMQRRLQASVPRLVALFITLAVIIVVVSAFGSLIGWALGRVGRWFINDAARFQVIYDQITTWLEGHGIAVSGIWTDNFSVSWILGVVNSVTNRVNTTVSFWLVAMVYVVLGLLEVEAFARKVEHLRNREVAQVLRGGLSATAWKLRRYMLVRTAMSIMTGIFVWAFARIAGLPLAEEWGLIAFALNYIPMIGPLIATLLPTLFAVTQFGSWEAIVLTFICLSMIQFVVGSYVEPRVSGSALAISPIIVLASVFLWAYLWGIFGAFIGVPITIAVVSFCAQCSPSMWVADLVSAEQQPTAPVR
ncbi:AI-2E family transporter [Enterovirga rhinocerotis]|uniref:Putative PurR-regulated permease PerM n=1 Tax=Enterovirga rhinocerotis TaxID=1339210 RepID=A0A4R7C7V4_9HYPH|nr:AI-2E family transporter [Enterovirga rhinocerotis]TDR94263.1 putative PurR-regulated permease PerM [Enterovirga rhinocerotis]